ncbi:MAG: hypothetical protein JWP35_3898 [Caulobacter sp.]|nr:hypothetical protein [Caulobacter sp.]
MSDLAKQAEPSRGRHVFLIEMDAAPDALMRALGPFALHDASVTGLELNHRGERMELRVEATGVCPEVAAHLGRKLDALPMVRGVGLGWRA